jgi:hypothetical protein
MTSALTAAALGWVTDAPSGNRLRWTFAGHPAAAPPAAPGNANDLRVAFARERPGGTALAAVTIERAALAPKPAWQPRPDLPWDLAAIPPDWWEPHGDVVLNADVPFAQFVLPAVAQAVSFRLAGGPARCVLRASNGEVVLDRHVAADERVVGRGADIASITLNARTRTLRDLETLDLSRHRALDFRPLAHLDIARGLDAPLHIAQTRLVGGTTIPPGDDWWEKLRFWCRGFDAPGEVSDPAMPNAWLRAGAARGSRFSLAVLTGAGFVDGPGVLRSSVEGDALLGEPLTEPQWVAYRIVSKPPAGGPPQTSNIVVCPPVAAPRLAPPWRVFAKPPASRYVSQRDVYEVTTSLNWQVADEASAMVAIDESVVDRATGVDQLRQSFECRHADRASGRAALPRHLDLIHRDVLLRWQLRAVDSWDRTSDPTPWTMDYRPTLAHRPTGPAFDSATHNGVIAALRPSKPLWQPDRCVREARGRLNIYRQRAPRTAEVTIEAPTLVAEGTYQVGVVDPIRLASFASGTLAANGTWFVVGADAGALTLLAPADGTGTIRLPAAGRATLHQSATDLDLYVLVATLPADALAALRRDRDGNPCLMIHDPVPLDGAPLAYRAAIDIDGLVGVPGPAVIAFAPTTAVTTPSFTATAHVAVSDGDYTAAITDYFGRSLVVVTLDVPAPAGSAFAISAAASPGDSPPDELTGGLFGYQQPADGRTLVDMIALPLPTAADRTIWVGLQMATPDGRVGPRAVVPASAAGA